MKYQFIQSCIVQFPLKLMCRVLSVTPQGYYQWKKRAPQRKLRERAQRALTDRIRVFHAESHRTYGSPRITKDLHESGEIVNKKKVARIMRENDIKARTKKRYKATTNSRHSHPVAQNILNRDFTADAPNLKWVGDITYIPTGEGWLYLAVVIDLFSRKVIGWELSDRMTSELVCRAMKMAIATRGCKASVLCHFDRGSQYAGYLFQSLLKKHGFICSMSRKGNCWDNSVAESFFKSLKVEAVVEERFRTRAEARMKIFEWLEGFYNTRRRYSSVGYMAPTEFERQFEQRARAA